MYHTVIKPDMHLTTGEKCKKRKSQVGVYISRALFLCFVL